MKSWKDPDTGVTHTIAYEEHKVEKPNPTRSMILHTMTPEEVAKNFFRRVTLACGWVLQLDSDEFIMPQGEAVLASPSPILRPWVTAREAPTCVQCAATVPRPAMVNDWGSTLRGA